MTGSLLPRGTQLRVSGAQVACVIGNAIGEGGQGTVYAATVGSSAYAVKWYHPRMADSDLRRRIAILIDRGSPDPRFLWPREEITDSTGHGFGYLMPLAPPGARELVALFAPSGSDAAFKLTLRERAQLGIEIVDCFLKLHASGFCYRDVNLGSFLIDPASLVIRVCDNDNIELNGATSTSVGTLFFMAPELVRGEAPPSTDTDLFSLAILLFYLMTDGHPLLGRTEYEIAYPQFQDWQRLLGYEPRFIFDSQDERNAALPGVHDRQIANWNTLPPGLCDIFARTFGEGLRSPRRRALASEWRSALAAVRDTSVTCGCPIQFDTVMSADRSTADGGCLCSFCGASLPEAPRLEIGGRRIVLASGARLLASHVGIANPGGDRTIGQAVKSPTGLNGLRNVGDLEWQVTDEGGQMATVPPGRAVTLKAGIVVNFGGATGRVLV